MFSSVTPRLLVLVVVPVLALATACGGGSSTPTKQAKDKASGRCSYVETGQEAARKVDLPPANPDPKAPTSATLRTSAGDIEITLEPDQAPCAVNSFLHLARSKYFDKTRCHRLTTYRIYVLQCGDPSATGDPKKDGQGTPGYSFADELVDNDPRLQPCRQVQSTTGPTTVCLYGPGIVAMANGGPDSNGSQFFLVYNRSAIKPGYTVLGHMDAAGLKVVRDIARAGIGEPGPGQFGQYDGEPKTEVTIDSVSVK